MWLTFCDGDTWEPKTVQSDSSPPPQNSSCRQVHMFQKLAPIIFDMAHQVQVNSTARLPPSVDSSWSQTMVLVLLSCFTTQLSPCLGLQSWVYSVNRRGLEHWEWRKREHVLVCLCGSSALVLAGNHNIGRRCYWECEKSGAGLLVGSGLINP